MGPKYEGIKVNIQIDVDGVLADFVKGFYDSARYYIPDLPQRNEFNQSSWDFEEIPDKIQNVVWKEIRESKVWWYELDPIPSPEERHLLSNLDYRDGINLYFVTARPGNYAKFLTERWIRTHCHLEHPTVIVAKNKAAIAKLLSIDYSIEDKGRNAEEIALVMRRPENSFLMDRQYNRLPYRATRVKSFGEFLEKIPV